MPGFSLNIPTADIARANAKLQVKLEKAQNLSRPFKRFAVYYDGVVQKTFRWEGRPARAWPILSSYTLALRKWSKRGEGPVQRRPQGGSGILSIRGSQGLKGSFNADIQPLGMKYGTSVPYAELHQKGGMVRRPGTRITAKKGRALKFQIGGQDIYRYSVFLPPKDFRVPQRKMITWLPEDEQQLEQLMEEHIK